MKIQFRLIIIVLFLALSFSSYGQIKVSIGYGIEKFNLDGYSLTQNLPVEIQYDYPLDFGFMPIDGLSVGAGYRTYFINSGFLFRDRFTDDIRITERISEHLIDANLTYFFHGQDEDGLFSNIEAGLLFSNRIQLLYYPPQERNIEISKHQFNPSLALTGEIGYKYDNFFVSSYFQFTKRTYEDTLNPYTLNGFELGIKAGSWLSIF